MATVTYQMMIMTITRILCDFEYWFYENVDTKKIALMHFVRTSHIKFRFNTSSSLNKRPIVNSILLQVLVKHFTCKKHF